MASFDRTCRGCGKSFVAGSSRAVWCSARCKKRGQRKPDAIVTDTSTETPSEDPPAGLVASVRRDLVKAGREETFSGQLALQLARKMVAKDATGVAGLSRELRIVLADALAKDPEPDEKPAADEPEDEVEKARRQRDEKRAAAGKKTS